MEQGHCGVWFWWGLFWGGGYWLCVQYFAKENWFVWKKRCSVQNCLSFFLSVLAKVHMEWVSYYTGLPFNYYVPVNKTVGFHRDKDKIDGPVRSEVLHSDSLPACVLARTSVNFQSSESWHFVSVTSSKCYLRVGRGWVRVANIQISHLEFERVSWINSDFSVHCSITSLEYMYTIGGIENVERTFQGRA